MQVSVHDGIDSIPPAQWDALAGDEYPFLQYTFLQAAEQSGSVTPERGWTPRHITISDGDTLLAAMPLYEKSHSWGEFVFDWAWANAYKQAGLAYYPKLISAVPFTPASSRRLLLADRDDTALARTLLQGAIELAQETNCSSLHLLFPAAEETQLLQRCGLKLRMDCQFHWHNRGYRDFDEFLAGFSSSKRKKARRDRRHVREAGIRFRHLHGQQIDAPLWRTIYALIRNTFLLRGSLPYFEREFFECISARQADDILVILAENDTTPVAAAICYVGAKTLYGRYWGANGNYNALHFETCYYQGIEYCIRHGLDTFEPGTQGEHKISRGFTPVSCWSAHWLQHAQFFDAIGNYLDEEHRYVDNYMQTVDRHSPFKHE